jgi:4-methyl-5(b-hydroxyethyl)-thiazole monophosphate biosynthesis
MIMNKVIVFLCEGCEEIELVTIADVLRRGGVEVQLTVIGEVLGIRGAHNMLLFYDQIFKRVNWDEVKMVVLPGGMGGTNEMKASKDVEEVVKKFINDENRIVAAICAAPTALGKFGVLEGRKATCYPGLEGELTGAQVVDADVVVDGNLITSRGPATAMPFALELLKTLKGEETAEAVAKGMLYK